MGHGLMNSVERRQQARELRAFDIAGAAARLRTGLALRILNASPDGLLVESPVRLLPGRRVDLVLQSGSTQEQAPWVVVHSRVGCINGGSDLQYRAGLRRATGNDYPQRREPRTGGNGLPTAGPASRPANTSSRDEPARPAVGTRFGRQDRT